MLPRLFFILTDKKQHSSGPLEPDPVDTGVGKGTDLISEAGDSLFTALGRISNS